MSEAILEIREVPTYYGHVHALKGISLSIAPGEIVALIGANGAGKTTTLRTVSGLLHPRRRRGFHQRQIDPRHTGA